MQEGQRTNQSRDALPNIEAEIRQVEQTYQPSERELERCNCYEYFLFSKSLRRTRALRRPRPAEASRRSAGSPTSRRSASRSSAPSEQSYRDDIVRELARNNCGANYTQEARRQDRGPFSSIWQDEEEQLLGNGWAPYGGAQSGATYRTVCVRLCDGYYFPVSFSTLPSHFEQDADACQSKCAAPVELYYYQNPGAAVDQSVALAHAGALHEPEDRVPLPQGAGAGLLVQGGGVHRPAMRPQAGKRADTGATTGWEARSDAGSRAALGRR